MAVALDGVQASRADQYRCAGPKSLSRSSASPLLSRSASAHALQALRGYRARARWPRPLSLAVASCIARGLGAVATLSGCVGLDPPDNAASKLYDPRKSAQRPQPRHAELRRARLPGAGHGRLHDAGLAQAPRKLGGRPSAPMRYSPGDRFNILVFGSPEFSGDYVINADGTVDPALCRPGRGGRPDQCRADARRSSGISARRDLHARRPEAHRPPGAIRARQRHGLPAPCSSRPPRDRRRQGLRQDRRVAVKFGDNPMERFVPAALRAAGGVRPDADSRASSRSRNGKTTHARLARRDHRRAGRRHAADRRRPHPGRGGRLLPVGAGAALPDHAARHPHHLLEPDRAALSPTPQRSRATSSPAAFPMARACCRAWCRPTASAASTRPTHAAMRS